MNIFIIHNLYRQTYLPTYPNRGRCLRRKKLQFGKEILFGEDGGRKEHYTVIAPGTEDALEQPMLLSEHSFVTDSQGRYVSQLGPALEFPEDRIQDLAPFGSLDYRYPRAQIERELARYNGGVLDSYDKESLDEGAKQSPRKITVIRPSRRKTTPKRNKQKK